MSQRKEVVLSVCRFDTSDSHGHYWVKFKVRGERTDWSNDEEQCNTPEEANEFIERRIREKYNEDDYELIIEDHTDHVYAYEGD